MESSRGRTGWKWFVDVRLNMSLATWKAKGGYFAGCGHLVKETAGWFQSLTKPWYYLGCILCDDPKRRRYSGRNKKRSAHQSATN